MPAGVAALLVVALIVVVAYIGASTPTSVRPGATQLVAGLTDAPEVPSERPLRSPDPTREPQAPPTDEPTTVPSAEPTGQPSAEPSVEPSVEPSQGPPATPGTVVTAIVPGAVDRSSLAVNASYRVNAEITVHSGALDVSTRIQARNDSGEGIDRLELNTVAARLGNIRVTAATVDDVPVKVTVRDQTLIVPLGGILPAGASATVRVAYRAKLQSDLTNSDWMFSRAGGTLALYRWIPWVSKALPFDRPNTGDPFVTASSPQVDVEILTDERMTLAAPAAKVDTFAAGAGSAWSFTMHDVRDVSVLLAPDFEVARGEAAGIPIRAYTRPGGHSGFDLVQLAEGAVEAEAKRLGVAFPLTTLVIVETEGGASIESPGLVWVTSRVDTRNREYAVYHGIAQQWFYGVVGNNQRAEPFADEAPADLLARTILGSLRSSACGRENLDGSIAAYSRGCYYEVVFVQGGGFLDDVRQRMGTKPFWEALGAYVEANRNGIGGTKQLLDVLRAGSDVNLMPLLKARFPSLY